MNFKLFLRELSFFGTTQLVGLFVAWRLFLDVKGIASVPSARPSLFDIFIFAFLIFLVAFFLKKFSRKSKYFYRIFLALAIFVGSQTVFSVFMPSIIAFIVAVILVYSLFHVRAVWLHNLAVVLSIGGIGAIFGLSVSPLFATLLLIALSFYDIIAVYKTKHMVTMARQMIHSGAIFGFIIPKKWKYGKKDIPTETIGDRYMILGSGDVALPLVLIVSTAKISFFSAVIVFFFALVGLFLMHFLFTHQKKKVPMAALPPIATLTIVGYLVSFLLV